jgi:hypothetical protein
VKRVAIVLVTASLPASALAAPAEELFLGESSQLSARGEVQVGAAMERTTDGLDAPVELELGLASFLELATELPLLGDDRLDGTVGLHTGFRRDQISARVGGSWAWNADMTPAWGMDAAVGITHGRLALFGSVERDAGLRAAVGASFAFGDVSPLVELAVERDLAAIAIGGVWRIWDDVELGLAAALDSDGEPAVFAHLITELDLKGDAR